MDETKTPAAPAAPPAAPAAPAGTPCFYLPGYPPAEADEISLLDCWRILWPQRWLVVAVTFGAALLAVIVSLCLPNIYRAQVLLAPVEAKDSKGGLSSALGSLGGLASLAGIPAVGGGNVEENLAVLQSYDFLTTFVADKKLMPVLFADDWDAAAKRWKEADAEDQPGPWDAYRLLTKEILKVSQDKKSGLVTVGISWTDAERAATWANELVARLNDYLQQQAIRRSQNNLRYLNEELGRMSVAEMRQTLFTLIADEQKKAMLANTQEEFAFRVLDQASPPDRKDKPKRSVIVILATMLAGMASLFFVFVRHWWRQQQEQDAAE